VLHQHTGSCVETRDETYAVMEAVNTRLVKFGPDVGQLQKGGSDPVKVVKDFLPAVRCGRDWAIPSAPEQLAHAGEITCSL
jgi:inosose dehydratase